MLFDLVKGAPGAASPQSALEAALAEDGLCVCAVVVAELGRYLPSEQHLRDFSQACQIDYDPITLGSRLRRSRGWQK